MVQRREYRQHPQRRPHSLFVSSMIPPQLPSIKPPPLPTTRPSTTYTPTPLYNQRIDDSIIYIDSVDQIEHHEAHDYHLIDELTNSTESKNMKKCSSNNSFDSSFEYIQATSSPDKDSVTYDSGCDSNSVTTQQTTQLLIEKLLNKCNMTPSATTTQLLLKRSSTSSLGDYIDKFSDVLLHTSISGANPTAPHTTTNSLLTQLCDTYNRSSCATMNNNLLLHPNMQAPTPPPAFIQLQQHHFM